MLTVLVILAIGNLVAAIMALMSKCPTTVPVLISAILLLLMLLPLGGPAILTVR